VSPYHLDRNPFSMPRRAAFWRHLEAQPGFNAAMERATRDLEEGKGVPFSEVRANQSKGSRLPTPTRAQDSQSPFPEVTGTSSPAPDVAAAIDELPEPLHDLGVDSGRQRNCG
jgi:hypothetical protein